ncbi:MAG: COX15/CtaA family protein [Bacteroidota bacterium]|nr:COX15/CtaA family protein [Bacteroidota bacterium]
MKTLRAFYKLSLSTLVAVYILILVGGVVRSTGSGMGCPDWPRCFGNWVPPTDVSQLPPDYKETYADYRHQKNLKFARYLRVIGMGSTADKLLSDESVLIESDFNPTKTWIEYFNRITGVIIGFLIFLVFVYSLKFWNSDRKLTILSFLTLVLVSFQGWLGSFVVSSNLTPWTITVHMFLALVIVAMLVYLVHTTSGESNEVYSVSAYWWLVACIAVVLVQILLGTHVREAIDAVARTTERQDWISAVGETFTIHRSFSWAVVLVHAGLVFSLLSDKKRLKGFVPGLIVLIVVTLLTGIGMAWFAVPPFLQPLHLLLATICFGVQFLFLLKMDRKRTVVLKN